MNRKNQYIATKVDLSYKKKKYNIRAINTEKNGDLDFSMQDEVNKRSKSKKTTTQKINPQNVNQRKAHDDNKSNAEETLKQTQEIDTNFLSGNVNKMKETKKIELTSDGTYLNLGLAFFGIIYIISTLKYVQKSRNQKDE
jgi:hypothetical protein